MHVYIFFLLTLELWVKNKRGRTSQFFDKRLKFQTENFMVLKILILPLNLF